MSEQKFGMENSAVRTRKMHRLRRYAALGICKSHPEFLGGETVHIIFHCPQYLMNDVADSFGTDVRADSIADGMMEVRVKAGEADSRNFARSFEKI